MRFRLVRLTADAAFFDGLTYRREGADGIRIQFAVRQRDGSHREEEFRYTRAVSAAQCGCGVLR
jgi:hypothetical protein